MRVSDGALVHCVVRTHLRTTELDQYLWWTVCHIQFRMGDIGAFFSDRPLYHETEGDVTCMKCLTYMT